MTATNTDMTTLSCPYGCGAKLSVADWDIIEEDVWDEAEDMGTAYFCPTEGCQGHDGYGFDSATSVYDTAVEEARDADRRLDDLYKTRRALQEQIRLAQAAEEHAHGQARAIAIEIYGWNA